MEERHSTSTRVSIRNRPPAATEKTPNSAAAGRRRLFQLALAAEVLRPDEPLRGALLGPRPGEQVRLAVLDGWGRVVADAVLVFPCGVAPPGAVRKPLRFSLPPDGEPGGRRRLVVLRFKRKDGRRRRRLSAADWETAAEKTFVRLPTGPRTGEDYLALATLPAPLKVPAAYPTLRKTLLGRGASGVFLPDSFFRAGGLPRRTAWPEGLVLFAELFSPRHGPFACKTGAPGAAPNRLTETAATGTNAAAETPCTRPPLFDENKLRAAWKEATRRAKSLNLVGLSAGWSVGDRPRLDRGNFSPPPTTTAPAANTPAKVSAADPAVPAAPAAPLVVEAPQTAALFRAWLRKEYGSLAAVNRQWETSFSSWEEITPPTATPSSPAASEKTPLPAEEEEEEEEAAAPTESSEETAETGNEEENGAGSEPRPRAAFVTPEPPREELNFSAACDFAEFLDFARARLWAEVQMQANKNTPGVLLGATGLSGAAEPGRLNLGPLLPRAARLLNWCAPAFAGEEGGPRANLARLLYHSFNPAGRTLTRLAGEQGGKLTPGGATDFRPARRLLWAGFLRGDEGVLLPKEATPRGPEFLPTKFLAALRPDLRALYGGLARQWRAAAPVEQAVGVYFSPRSLRLRRLLSKAPREKQTPETAAGGEKNDEASTAAKPRFNRAGRAGRADDAAPVLQQPLAAWQALLSDLGYRTRFVDAAELCGGGLRPGKVKALVLPETLCLSDAEATALRKYARAGGVVIADCLCGLYDGRGKRRVPKNAAPPGSRPTPKEAFYFGALDEDFGVGRQEFCFPRRAAGATPAAELRLQLRDPWSGTPFGPESAAFAAVESGLRAGGAWNFGVTVGKDATGRPLAAACLSRAGGLGRFIFLNLRVADYLEWRRRPAAADFRCRGWSPAEYAARFGRPRGGEALRLIVGDLLTEAVGIPRPTVRTPAGAPARDLLRVLRRNGNHGAAWLAALLPLSPPGGSEAGAADGGRGAAPQEVTVALPAARYWYDLLEGGRLGFGPTCRVRLRFDRPVLLAVLPYRVDRLRVTARRRDRRGVFELTVRLETSAAVRGVSARARRSIRHVLALSCFDPAGRHLPAYDRLVEAVGGKWTGRITLGRNEPPGEYCFIVRDVQTGTTAERTLLKETDGFSAVYAELFPSRATEHRWRPVVAGETDEWISGTPSPVAASASVKVRPDAGGRVIVRRRMELRADGPGAGPRPEARLNVSAPWTLRGKRRLPAPPPLRRALWRYHLPDLLDPQPLRFSVEVSAPLSVLLRSVDGEPRLKVELRGREGKPRQWALPLGVVVAPRTGEKIAVDGRVTETVWRGCGRLSSFRRLADDGPAAAETRVKFRHDSRGLYLAAVCRPPRGNPKQDKNAAAEKPETFAAVLVLESPAGATTSGRPTGFRLTSAGCLEILAASGAAEKSLRAKAAALSGGGWSLEAAIPWKSLGLKEPPAAGRVLRVNVVRSAAGERSARRNVRVLIVNP